MAVLTRHRFSSIEYHRMAATGVLGHAARVELLEGEIRDMSPIGPSHAAVTKRLNHYFSQIANGRWLVAVQDPLQISEYSEPQPDLMLLKFSADFYGTRHPIPAEVFLLLEIADTSLAYDREEKLPVYGRAGIPEVWLVNLEDQTIEVYRDPYSEGYRSNSVLRAGQTAVALAFSDVSVEIAALFKRG
jgi:Uma2 family endonuclease